MHDGTLRALLRTRYCAPEWALLEEVRNRTGYGKEERYADAVAMNLYPSRGLEVHGFEIKVSKSDWKRELANPAKSAAIQRFCVGADTPILCADLLWRPAGGLSEGCALLGFEEEPQLRSSRRWLSSTVAAHRLERLQTFRVCLESGERLVCTPGHKWLCRSGGVGHARRVYWMTVEEMKERIRRRNAQLYLPKYLNVWAERTDYGAGFLSAAFDGEGCLAVPRNNWRLDFAQNPNALLARVKELLSLYGYAFKQRNQQACVRVQLLGGMHEIWRFLGEMRSPRQLDKFYTFVEHPRQMRSFLQDRVVAVEENGLTDVAVMSTTTRTFIASGYASHNCDRWYIVAPLGVVDKVELPRTWGLMETDKEGTKLIIKVEAPPLEAEPLGRPFIASMLRNTTEALAYRLSQATFSDEAYAKGKKDGEERYVRDHKLGMETVERRLKATEAELNSLKLGLQDFEKKSGLKINSYDGPRIGDAVHALMQFGQRNRGGYSGWLRTALQRVREPLEDVLKVIQQVEEAAKFIGVQHEQAEDSSGDAGSVPGAPESGSIP